MFGSSSTKIVQPALGQGEDQFPVFSNETLTPAQRSAREQLLKQEGFSVHVLARNLSAPLNLLYGPDDKLWITERVGKDIIRIDPINGTKLSSTPVPNVHQSAAQDGLLGMTFDPRQDLQNSAKREWRGTCTEACGTFPLREPLP
jgi:glucose/arabinose dehydrogenase